MLTIGRNGSFFGLRLLQEMVLRYEEMSHKRQTSLWTSSGDVPKSHWAFNPTRFALVRKRLGLTKIGLARELGIGLRSVAAYELGEYPPSDDVLKKLVSISGFPP